MVWLYAGGVSLILPDVRFGIERLHLENARKKLLDNSAILRGNFNGSSWGECDFVCTTSSPLRASLPNTRTRLGTNI